MHFIIGTAGHVDHGKTTLIRALTGIETDRLREEKERGLSIVPGFAHLALPDGRVVGIVDVPGHERFLKNMLSGVAGVDVAMLVIAADEGVMPQTTEHLRVLELLQIKRGVVVLTKCDAVDDEWLMLAREDVRTRLEGSFFATAPLVEVAAPRGTGLDELKRELARLCAEVESEITGLSQANNSSLVTHPSSLVSRPFRMAIDRAFTISGFGTVVTGSAADGALAVGEAVEVWQPGATRFLSARVRGAEVHGEAVQRAERGQRTALNLSGVSLDEAARGGVIAAPGTLHAALVVLEVWLRILTDAPRGVKDRAPVRLHTGTSEVGIRVGLYEGTRLNQGEAGYARLRLDAPLVCARGDRFILREVATERIVGGGIILETEAKLSRTVARAELPSLHAALEAGDEADVATILLRRSGAAGLTEARLRFELRRLEVTSVLETLRSHNALWSGSGVFLHGAVALELKETISGQLRAFHEREPLQTAMPREALRAMLPVSLAATTFDALLDEMAQAHQIVVSPTGVRLAGHRVTLSEEETRLKERIESLTYGAAWQPLTLDELVDQLANRDLGRKLCFALIKAGSLVRVGDFVVSARRIAEGAEILRSHIRQQGSLAVGEARDLLGSTRKWLVPILEYYDKSGLTKRAGEVRVLR